MKITKIANKFELKLKKYAQDALNSPSVKGQEADVNEQLLGLKSQQYLKTAQELAINSVNDNFSGKLNVFVVVKPDLSFGVVCAPNTPEVSKTLTEKFASTIKWLLSGVEKKPTSAIKFNWFAIEIG